MRSRKNIFFEIHWRKREKPTFLYQRRSDDKHLWFHFPASQTSGNYFSVIALHAKLPLQRGETNLVSKSVECHDFSDLSLLYACSASLKSLVVLVICDVETAHKKRHLLYGRVQCSDRTLHGGYRGVEKYT